MTYNELHDVPDPRKLKAFSHPVRLRLIEELFLSGPATATELAERVGESPANCSWHLRQLARYGYLEEAGGGTGRQRPWRAVTRPRRWRADDEAPELAAASDEASRVLLGREVTAMLEWLAGRRAEPPEWRDAGFTTQSLAWLTADELRDLHDEMNRLITRHLDRAGDPAARPTGSRPVRLVAWGVPARPTGVS